MSKRPRYLLVPRLTLTDQQQELATRLGATPVVCGFWPKEPIPVGVDVINWGRSEWPIWSWHVFETGGGFVNDPTSVGLAVDKVKSFEKFIGAGIPIPEYTDSRDEAARWIREEGRGVYCRINPQASRGQGLVYWGGEPITRLPIAPLYTKGETVEEEYRIAVVNGRVVSRLKKIKVRADADPFVRTPLRGWGYQESVEPDPVLDQLAVDAVGSLCLHFGGVDIIRTQEKLLCVEVNSAPGLGNKLLMDSYVQGLEELMVT